MGSIYLGRVAIAITAQLNITYLLGLCSPATLRNSLKVGFEVLTDLGNKGTFYYPKQDLTATGLIIKDIVNLPRAEKLELDWINKLRNNFIGNIVEKGPKGELEIFYETRLSVIV